MKYKAIIFDLDGTVLDTLGDLAESVNFALKEHGLPLKTKREVRFLVGNGVKNLVFRAAGETVVDEEKEEILGLFREHYPVHCTDNTYPYAGITELLNELKNSGVKMGVVSNKPDREVKKLVEKNFPGIFDYISGEKQGVPRKPSPEGVVLALESLGEIAEDSVYVGDSDVDILTAKNSGTDGIIVTWGFRDKEFLASKEPQYMVDTATELRTLLLES